MKKVETFQIVTLDNAHNTEVVIEQTDFNETEVIPQIINRIGRDVRSVQTMSEQDKASFYSQFKNFKASVTVGKETLRFAAATWSCNPDAVDQSAMAIHNYKKINSSMPINCMVNSTKNTKVFIDKTIHICGLVIKASSILSSIIGKADDERARISDLHDLGMLKVSQDEFFGDFEEYTPNPNQTRDEYMEKVYVLLNEFNKTQLAEIIVTAIADVDFMKISLNEIDNRPVLYKTVKEVLDEFHTSLKVLLELVDLVQCVTESIVCAKSVLYSNIANLQTGSRSDIKVVSDYIIEQLTRKFVKVKYANNLTAIGVFNLIQPIILKYIARTNSY